MKRQRELDVVTCLLIEEVVNQLLLTVFVVVELWISENNHKRQCRLPMESYTMIGRIPEQVRHLNRLVAVNNLDCINNLRMDRNTFGCLVGLLRELGGLHDSKYVSVEEQIAMFLSVMAHHKKNKVVKFDFLRSGQTVSHYIHLVLRSILKLHMLFLVNPEPITEESTDPRWKWFKGCLGALDGTYVDVHVNAADKPRYRTRKGNISTNVLAVCDYRMRFVYVLPGWEGSAADSRVLRDAISRPHGLKVPKGYFYLCDNGYANIDGFLTPYKGVRYHLNEWNHGPLQPQTTQELFNMRHTRARNVIERAFGIMKMRRGILRSATYYPIKTQCRLIMACFLLHNFIRSEMVVDPIEQQMDNGPIGDVTDEEHPEYIGTVEASVAWNTFRDEVAQGMSVGWT